MLVKQSLLPAENLVYRIAPQDHEQKLPVLIVCALHDLVTMNTTPQIAAMLTLALLQVTRRSNVIPAVAKINPVDAGLDYIGCVRCPHSYILLAGVTAIVPRNCASFSEIPILMSWHFAVG